MKENRCPGCKGDRIVHGRYFNPNAVQNNQTRAPRFKPDALKKFTLFDPSVAILGKERFCACLDCCFLWSRVDPKKLTKSIQKNGTEAAVQSIRSYSEAEVSS